MRVERLYGSTKLALTKQALTKPALTKPAAAVCGSSAYMAPVRVERLYGSQLKHLAYMAEVGELTTLTKPASNQHELNQN